MRASAILCRLQLQNCTAGPGSENSGQPKALWSRRCRTQEVSLPPLAGAKRAKELGLISKDELCILDSTAHQLKFVEFQNMYFDNAFPPEFEVTPDMALANTPELVISPEEKDRLSADEYTSITADKVVAKLGLEKK